MATKTQFDLMLSLKCISSTKVAIVLWNHVHSVPLKDFLQCQQKWQRINNEIRGHIDYLQLPALLKQELNCLVKQIGKQIMNFLECHQEHFDIFIASISQFCWTIWGAIDKRKTAELFLEKKGIGAIGRLTLASNYCLDTYIPILWNRLSRSEQTKFLCSCINKPHMRYWAIFVKYDSDEDIASIGGDGNHIGLTLHEAAFNAVVQCGNVDATKYFWFKLNTRERNNILFMTARSAVNKNYGDILHFLLFQMNEEEQTELFQSNPVGVLKCLTNWPLHDFVLQALSCIRNFLEECDDSLREKYCDLFMHIARKEYEYCDTCIYKDLFTKLWKGTPVVMKKYVLNTCNDGFLLIELLKHNDVRNIKLMLGEASPELKRKILLGYGGYTICDYFVSNLDLMELFVGECASSEDDVTELKQKLRFWITGSKATKIRKMLSIVCDRIQQQKHKRFKSK